MKRYWHSALATLACAISLPATAIDFVSVAEPAILFDRPTPQANRLALIGAGTPVEKVVMLNDWVKVRDPSGTLSWLPASALAPRRTVIVATDAATVRRDASDEAPVAFQARKDVVLEFTGASAPGWAGVRHEGGATGFIRVSEVWGL